MKEFKITKNNQKYLYEGGRGVVPAGVGGMEKKIIVVRNEKIFSFQFTTLL